jgi:hypothetical protein
MAGRREDPNRWGSRGSMIAHQFDISIVEE